MLRPLGTGGGGPANRQDLGGGISIPVVAGDGSGSSFGQRTLTGLTNVWPGDDSYAFPLLEDDEVRAVRFKAIKTAGATAGATLKFTLDAPDESSAQLALTFAPLDPNNTDEPFNHLYDGEWSEWVVVSTNPALSPIRRVDFLPTNDTWTVIMEKG